jgi:hypothetical protein
MLCTDIKGIDGVDNANTWGARFYDNGVYIGHDEPDMTFLSSRGPLGQRGDVDRDAAQGSRRRPHSEHAGIRRLALVRAEPSPMALDGSVRSEFLSTDAVHARERRERTRLH